MKEKEIKKITKEAVDSAYQAKQGDFSAFEKEIDWGEVASDVKRAHGGKRDYAVWLKPALIAGVSALVIGIGVGIPIGIAVKKDSSEQHYEGNTNQCILEEGNYAYSGIFGSESPPLL